MLGIDDPGIYMAYIIAMICVVFSLWFGITHWNKENTKESDDSNDSNDTESDKKSNL